MVFIFGGCLLNLGISSWEYISIFYFEIEKQKTNATTNAIDII